MKVNVTQVLTDLDDKAIPMADDRRAVLVQLRELIAAGEHEQALAAIDSVVDATEPLTVRKVATQALLTTMKGDESLDGDRKAAMWLLAMKIQREDTPDLDTGKDIALLKERVGKAFGALVVGQVFLLLNGTPATA